MEAVEILRIAEWGQSATMLTCLIAFIPQWITIYTNKTSENISLKSWLLWLLASCLAVQYAVVSYLVTGVGFVLILSTVLTLSMNTLTIGMILFYRPTKKHEADIALEVEALDEASESIYQLELLTSQAEELKQHESITLS